MKRKQRTRSRELAGSEVGSRGSGSSGCDELVLTNFVAVKRDKEAVYC
jgi:hypothetical protein